MKRIIPLILVFVITLTCMVSPVSASSFEMPERYFNVLDYATPNGFRSTAVSLPDAQGTVSFDVPGKLFFNYVDILVSSTAKITSAVLNSSSLTVVAMQGSMYRIYGSIEKDYLDSLNLGLFAVNACTVTFLSFHAFNNVNPISLIGTMDVSDNDGLLYSETMSTPSQTLGYSIPLLVNDSSLQEITIDFSCAGSNTYDFICFTFRTRLNVKSIIAMTDDGVLSLPVNVSYSNDFEVTQDSVYYTCLVDIRNLTNESWHLQIRCNRRANNSGVTTFYDVTGLLDLGYVDPELSFFRQFASNVEDWFDELIDSVKGNSSSEEADEFNDSISDQSQELEDMTNIMGSVEKPDINNINFNPSTMVDSNTLVLATSGLSNVLGNQIIVRILLMALTFALVGFILYGKK